MTVETFINDRTLVIMTPESEKEGLTFLGASFAKDEFEKRTSLQRGNVKFDPGTLCHDINGRKGYCVTFNVVRSYNH